MDLPCIEVELSLFGEIQHCSRETPITYSKHNFSPLFSNNPIIILRSLYALGKTIVIDGNHRVSFAKSANFNQISAFLIDDDFLIENSLFLDQWSLDYFLFSIDLAYYLEQKKFRNTFREENYFSEYLFFKRTSYVY